MVICMRRFFGGIVLAFVLTGCHSACLLEENAEEPTPVDLALENDKLLFCVDFSEGLFVAAKGGNVEGHYSRRGGNFSFAQNDAGEKHLKVSGDGKDSLWFSAVGNIVKSHGRIDIAQSYSFNSSEVADELKKKNERSKSFYLFSSVGGSEKVLLFYEVYNNSRVVLDCALFDKGKWRYFYSPIDQNKHKPNMPFNVGCSWGNGKFRLMIDGKPALEKDLDAMPLADRFFIGSVGGSKPFCGKIYSVKIYGSP